MKWNLTLKLENMSIRKSVFNIYSKITSNTEMNFIHLNGQSTFD